VGYDDDRELKLSGSSSALPIWTEFMKLATRESSYHDVQPFEAPPGIVVASVRMTANLPGGGSAVVRNEYFIEGTEPREQMPRQTSGGILSKLFHGEGAATLPTSVTAAPVANDNSTLPAAGPDEPQQPGAKKSGVLKRFFAIFKGKNSRPAPPPDAQKKAQPEG
jgi:hypothetical protein